MIPELSFVAVSGDDWIQAQRNDVYWGPVFRFKESGQLTVSISEDASRAVVALAANCEIVKGVLHCVWMPSSGPRTRSVLQVAVPESKKEAILSAAVIGYTAGCNSSTEG